MRFVLWLALSFLTFSSFGQAHLRGSVTDGQQQLPFVTLLLLNRDSVLLKGAVTDSSGTFDFNSLKPGHYRISASMTGYLKFTSRVIEVTDKDVLLPVIVLTENVTALKEVEITGARQLFEQQIDRLVINVSGNVTSSGNTILEILQKSPGVVVNKEGSSITMNGRSGVRLMINEKMIQVPLDVAVQMLDGMNASNVEKIELITAPSSKYDAEGNAGIIHIVTKGNTDVGTNVSFGLTAGFRWAETLGGNFSISHRGRKIAYFTDYTILRTHNLHVFEMDRRSTTPDFVQTVHVDSRRENLTTQQNINAGLEWNLTPKTIVNVLFTGYRRNWSVDANAKDVSRLTEDSRDVTDIGIHESNIWQSATGSVGFQQKLRAGSGIGFSFDYLYYHNNNPSQYNNTAIDESGNVTILSPIDLQKKTPIRVLTSRLDYRRVLSSALTIETGVKGVTSALDNDVLVRRKVGDEWIVDPDFTSYSTLAERIGAVYVSTQWIPETQWQVNSGLRYEYTHTNIRTAEGRDLMNRKYGYFFPSLSVKRSFTPERDLQFSYSRRITRPTYNDMAPYVFFWGTNTFSSGNTSLYPSLSDAVMASYHLRQWIVSAQFSHVKHEIVGLQPEIDQLSNALIYRSQNLNFLNTVGITNSISTSVTSRWELNSSLLLQYQQARTSHLVNNITLRQYGMNLNIISRIRLGDGFSVEVSGVYQSKSIAGVTKFLRFGSLNAGVQKSFGEKGTLRLAMDDMLATNNWWIRTNSPENNLTASFDYAWHNRFVRLTYTRSLGNIGMKAVKVKSGAEEERGRVN